MNEMNVKTVALYTVGNAKTMSLLTSLHIRISAEPCLPPLSQEVDR